MNAHAGRAVDGDESTAWRSEGYSSARFGGLHKSGVGLVLDLGQPTAVHDISLTLPVGPTDVVVYATDRRTSIQGATELASEKNALGPVTATVTAAAKTRYVVVWFSTLVQSGGKYRAAVAEISLR